MALSYYFGQWLIQQLVLPYKPWHVEWYHVCWPRLTAKRVEPVVSISWCSCYVTVIRPVLEYCSVVWHHGLTKAQAESLEAIQRRGLRIIYPVTYDFPDDAVLSIAQVASLFDRREQLNRHFFKSILSQSCIFSLLPPPRDLNVPSRLRTASTYPRPTTRTKRYTSFVQHGSLTITLPNWIGQHHLSTQALSSFIYYCYFCCIDIQYCAYIFKLVCYATVYCEI